MRLDVNRLESAALGYLEQWRSYDERFSSYISDPRKPMGLRVEVLLECLNYYSISRNVQPQLKELMNYDLEGYGGAYNPEKHRQMLIILDNFKVGHCWVDNVTRLEIEFREHLDNRVRLLSLSSKVLWQKIKGNCLVFDNDARNALRTPKDDIARFYEQWEFLYQKNACLIRDVVGTTLRKPEAPVLCFSIEKYECDWFYRRVFDVYLVMLSRKKKK